MYELLDAAYNLSNHFLMKEVIFVISILAQVVHKLIGTRKSPLLPLGDGAGGNNRVVCISVGKHLPLGTVRGRTVDIK